MLRLTRINYLACVACLCAWFGTCPAQSKLIIARHGTSDYDPAKPMLVNGVPDPPLSPVGKEEALRLARLAQAEGVNVIVHSPLRRARETAEIVGRELKLNPVVNAALTEFNLGDLLGKDWSQSPYREQFAEVSRHPDNKRPGGESFNELSVRATKALRELRAQHRNQNLLLIAHGITNRALLGSLRGLSTAEAYALPSLANTEVIIVNQAGDVTVRDMSNSRALPNAQTTIDFGALERSIAEEMKAQNVPGAQVAVISGDRVVWQKGFGVANAETREPVTTDTLFRLGSTTKMFVAAAAVALAEQGKLDLNKPAGEYAKGLHPQIARLTLHQLLSHTAGLKDEAPMTGPLDETALAQRVRGWNESMFFAEPGKVCSYSNPGYVLAGYVIEQVAGKPFADAMNELVFQPLGMQRSTFRPTMAMTWPLAQGHNATAQGAQVIRPFAEHAGNWPPGSLFSNVNECSRFLLALLNQGKLEGKQALSASLVQSLAAQKAVIPALDRQYGYGLISFKERGVQVVMSTGGRSGFGSIFYTAPEQRFAVVILTNRTGVIFSRSARTALELVVPLSAQEQSPPPQPLTMTAEEMAGYAGRYVNSEGIRAELIVQDGKLFARLGGRQIAVNKIGANRFQAPGGAQLSEFVLLPGADGKPEFLAAEMWALRRIK